MKSWRLVAYLCLLLGVSVPSAQAALAGEDDEARRAILDLRQKMEIHREAQSQAIKQALQTSLDQSQKQFEALRKQFEAVSKQVEADINQSKQENRQALLLLQAQIESLKQDTANFQGEREQLLREISLLQRAQKNINAEIEGRFQKIQAQLAKQDAPPPSPPVNEEAPKSIKVNVQVDGFEFLAEPEEKRDFEAAFVLFRKGDFAAAAKEFAQFVRVYSNSGYKPSALYWLGSAKFARRDFNDAITQLKGLVNDFPTHTRAAEALLTVGNAQLEIKQPKEARKTFNDLIKIYPTSEAAAAAKDRLTQIK
jgi:tol-pal system protein YbgF